MFGSTSQFRAIKRLTLIPVCVVALLFCLFSFPASAGIFSNKLNLTEEEKAWIAEHPVLRFGVDVHYEPYEFVSRSGEYKGISADYLKLIAEKTGLQFERVPGLSWGDVVTRLKRKQLDFAPTMVVTKDREKRMLFTDSYVENPFVIATKTDESGYEDEQSLRGKKVALARDHGVNESLLEKVPGITPIFYSSDLESLQAVSAGKADATIGHLGALAHHIQSHSLVNLKIAATANFTKSDMGMAVRNDWPILVSIFDKALDHIDEAERNAIAQRWITVEQDIYPDAILMSEVLLLALGFILPLAFWNKRLRTSVQLKAGQFHLESLRRRESEKRFLTLFENAPEAIVVVDLDTGSFAELNSNAEVLFGMPKSRLSDFAIWDLCPVRQPLGGISKDLFKEKASQAMAGESLMFEWFYRNSAGEERPCEMRLVKLPSENYQHLRCSMIDIYERKIVEKDLKQLAEVFSNAVEAVAIIGVDHKILRVNQAFVEITGHRADQVVGEEYCSLMAAPDREYQILECRQALERHGVWQGEVLCKKKSGELFSAQQSISPVKNNEGDTVQWVCLFSDITEKKLAEERLYRLAHYDSLTGLPNRTHFIEALDRAISLNTGSDKYLALLILGLDHFKHINDSLGHPVGDAILEEVSKRLKVALREEDIVARLAGDEFVVLLPGLTEPGYAANVASNLKEMLSPAVLVGDKKLNVTASIGISLESEAVIDAATLIKHAESAMYHAKEMGRNRYDYYTPQLTDLAMERVTLGAELHRAIQHKELEVWYQPQYCLETGEILSAEALVRWPHPDLGVISPSKFIPIAEELGLINALGQLVMHQACLDMAGWLEQGLELSVVAVNVSGHQVHSADFETVVWDTLRGTGLRPDHLQLEITESVIMERAEYTIELMTHLKSLGITIAIDDFGTGYSSLSYLKELPVNKLKIDRAFVMNLPFDEDDKVIVRTIIALAKNLGLEVIAEGVEDVAQQQFLLTAGCAQGQGYLRGKPMPKRQFEELVRHPEWSS